MMNTIITNETKTGIAIELISHYIAADYQINVESNIINFHINRYSEPLSQLLTVSDYSHAIFITAFNPRSHKLSITENLARNVQLRLKLNHTCPKVIAGRSADSSGVWPVEDSFLALGLDVETGKILAREFGQNAIIWIKKDAIPRLVLLH